jgi:hypothetical protein
LIGEPGSMQRRIQKLSGSISGKHSSGSIGAMSCRGQSNDQNRSILIAK